VPNQKYTKEFRKEAVKLALESDEPKQKIADNLGVKYKTLLTWITLSMKVIDETDKPVDFKSRYQELVSENSQLKKELKQTKLEREILKKAAAYFANQNM
jgi:transposase